MNELHLVLAIYLVNRENAVRPDNITKSVLVRLMSLHLDEAEVTMLRVYLREVDFMITARYLTSYNHLHLRVTPAGEKYLQTRGPALARMLQMTSRAW